MGIFDKIFGPPSKNRFARLMLKAIKKAGERTPIRYDAKEFRLIVEGEGKRFVNLGNVYQEYCATPVTKQQQALRHFVRSWFANRKEIPTTFEDAAPDLLASVRNRSYFEFTRLQAQLDGLPTFDWPHRVIAEYLALSLIYDLPEALMQVTQQQLSDWGHSFDEALYVACENLRRISHER